jgi:hypothetical protein
MIIKNKKYSILVILLFIGLIILGWKKFQTIESLREINYSSERNLFRNDADSNESEMNYRIETNLTPKLAQATEAAKIDKTVITTNPCMGSFALINSEFSIDICKEYGDNYTDLNEKCKKISTTNCTLTDCCVLIDGEKCRAGSSAGPNFSTEDGVDIDYEFYLYKNNCYGACNNDSAESIPVSLSACTKYSDNSTNISKDCMMQMFNKYACQANIRNPEESFVTPEFAEKFKGLSKKELRDSFKDTCSAYYKECEKYDDDSKGVSTECMVQMLNRLGCPNQNPELSGAFIDSTQNKTKREVKTILIDWVNYVFEMIKNKSSAHTAFCYGD